MQPAVPLVYEFQLNGRVTLTVLATGLHQSNLTVSLDVVDFNGETQKLSTLNSGLVTALNTAIKNLVISNQAIPS